LASGNRPCSEIEAVERDVIERFYYTYIFSELKKPRKNPLKMCKTSKSQKIVAF